MPRTPTKKAKPAKPKAKKAKAKIPVNPPRKKRKPGRPCIPILTVPRLADALRRSMGNKTRAAKRLRVHRSSVQEFVDRYPELRDVIMESEEIFKDDTVDAMHRQIKKGNIAAIIYTLKTKAKDRGFVEEKALPPLEMLFALLGPVHGPQLRALLAAPVPQTPLNQVPNNEPPAIPRPDPVPVLPPVPGTTPANGHADLLRPSLNGDGHDVNQGQNHPPG